MAINEQNTSINSFTKGMNTDVSYSIMQEGLYLYAENLRNYALNEAGSQSNDNNFGRMRAIEGFKEVSKTFVHKDSNGSDIEFNIKDILAANSIRNLGVIVVRDDNDNWGVIRFQLKEDESNIISDEDKILGPKLIYYSGTGKNGTSKNSKLSGKKVSIVLTWETSENIKLYIADGEHEMKILNIASSQDNYNLTHSGKDLFTDTYKSVILRPIIFCGLTFGQLSGGSVQYAYRLYNKRGSATEMSTITKIIPLGKNAGVTDNISENTRGGLYEDVLDVGVKLRFKIRKADQESYDHILLYRIHHKKGGESPTISLISNSSYILDDIENDDNNGYFDFTDYGQSSLEDVSVDDFNQTSGIHIIPKVIESKNDRLFAANIKDVLSESNDVGNLFDAKTFRVNIKNEVEYDGVNRGDYDEFIKNRNITKADTQDYITTYTDVNRDYTPYDKTVCKFLPKSVSEYTDKSGEKYLYYGGAGEYISWRFVIVPIVGDGSYSSDNQIGSRNNIITYEDRGVTGDFSTSRAYYYVALSETKSKNIVIQADDSKIDLSNQIQSSETVTNDTYANPQVAYALKSLRRDELYRFGIILYNSKFEGTSVLWIDDIRTPSIKEPGFETYFANSKSNAKLTVDLMVYSLGVEFNVDINKYNQLLYKKYGEDYEKYRIAAYEIVRARRTDEDVQTVAQGVLSRPIQNQTNVRDASSVVDKTFTPSGIISTLNYWTGENWLARNGNWENDTSWTNYCEADNFENKLLFLFICPEIVYNNTYFDNLLQNSTFNIMPMKYVFGQRGMGSLDRYKYQSYDCDVVSYDKLTLLLKYVPYDYIPCGPNLSLGLIPSVKTNNGSNGDSLVTVHIDYFSNTSDNGSIYFKPSLTKFVLKDGFEYGGDPDQQISGLQELFICQLYVRNILSFYNTTPNRWNNAHINDASIVDRLQCVPFYYYSYTIPKQRIATNLNPPQDYEIQGRSLTGTDNSTSNNNININPYSYCKLYEQSDTVFVRKYNSDDYSNKILGESSPNEINQTNISDNNYKYKIKNAKSAKSLLWNSLYSTKTENSTESRFATYTNDVINIGNVNYCNVVASGTYNNTNLYVTADKSKNTIFNGKGKDIFNNNQQWSALVGIGGSCVLLYLDSDDNILYKNIATHTVKRIDKDIDAASLDVSIMRNLNYDQFIYNVSGNDEEEDKINSYSFDNNIDWIGNYSIFRASIAGTYLCNLRKTTVPYGGYNYDSRMTTSYVSYGDTVIVEDYIKDNKAENEKKSICNYVFNGDCFISPFEYTSCHKYYDKDIECSITANITYAIPVETNINLAYTSGDEFYRICKQKGSSNIQEAIGNVNDMFSLTKPQYEYNTVYSVQPYVQSKEAADTSSDSNTLYDVDYRCYYSEMKSNNENVDSWQTFKAANYLDVDDRYGEITHLRTFNDKLIFWQESATGAFSVNERSLISDDSGKPVSLGTGSILERYDYLDRTSGMHKEQFCDTCSATNLYWFDSHNNEIKMLSGNGIVEMNKTYGTLNLMNNYTGIETPQMFYDKKYNELISKVLNTESVDKSLAYNELIQAFTSVYDVDFDASVTFPNSNYLLSVNDDSLKIYKWDVKSEELSTKLKFVVSKAPLETKVFDNQEIVTEENLNSTNPFEKCIFSWKTNLNQNVTSDKLPMTDREGCFKYVIPRENDALFGNRLRGKHLICEIDGLGDTSLSYIVTKFRKSWN